jgi:processive 1,2-diacylglycerol beta-glucosyltransferase
MMDASDCIITKPGGLTSSESLAKGLPMVIVNPIPGQEDRNTEFLTNNGVAMAVTSTSPIDEVLYQLFANPRRFDIMKESISLVAKPNSTRDICEFAMKICQKQ